MDKALRTLHTLLAGSKRFCPSGHSEVDPAFCSDDLSILSIDIKIINRKDNVLHKAVTE